jgi:hypothetical protein
MNLTVGDLRTLIDGLPDDTPIGLSICLDGEVDELTDVKLVVGVQRKGDHPLINVFVGLIDDEDDMEDFDDVEDEPTGSCDDCGSNLYGDENSGGLCDQCAWRRAQS